MCRGHVSTGPVTSTARPLSSHEQNVSLDSSGGTKMLRKLMLVAATLVVPALLAAQDIPNSHASDTAKSKVAAHRQNPQVPAQEATDTAKSRVAQHRTSKIRGSAVGTANRPVTPATPATPSTPSSGGSAGTPASPATPATPAVPASPSKKPSSPGSQAANHRP